MKRLIAVLVLVLLPFAAEAQEPGEAFKPFAYPTNDDVAVYTFLDIKKLGNGQVETTSLRVGKRTGSTAYTRRRIDCLTRRFQVLASVFSFEDLEAVKPDETWHARPFPGGSDDATITSACTWLATKQ